MIGIEKETETGIFPFRRYLFRKKSVLMTEGESTKAISEHAFAECTALRFLTVPAGVTEIDPTAFDRIETLTLRAAKGSAAEAFANEHGIPCCIIEPDQLTGDLNNDKKVDSTDAQHALIAATESLAGNDSGLSEIQLHAADINGSGTADVSDAQYILIYYTEKELSGNDFTWDDAVNR